MNRIGRLAVVVLSTLTIVTLLGVPAQAATPKPKAKADKVTIVAGSSKKVAVVKNDKVAAKSKAKVRLVGKRPSGVSARVSKQTVVVKVSANAKPGRKAFVYQVIDSKKRKAKAKVYVTVKAKPVVKKPAPTAGTLTYWINTLPVTAENRTGYDRDQWKHWIDADKNGCDTRREVLIVEAVVKPTVGAKCALSGGKWISHYDGAETTNPSTFDIDHMVPLAEAHDSGGHAWNADRKQAYANDLGYDASLVAVSASSNRSKGDKDPAEWLPPLSVCRYVTEWVSVKYRWGLTIDTTEKAALVRQAAPCPQNTKSISMPRKA
ncbi:DUF1524 domain-containing protein [Aeromicrobium sp. 179-A 4D2 NHS]|uniref:HNH endonuclease family protein n=1 Tax=Aeromicrobium sp. 179-A 4D2 NHS TaxID=3142375 RepID=UPI00399F6D2A